MIGTPLSPQLGLQQCLHHSVCHFWATLEGEREPQDLQQKQVIVCQCGGFVNQCLELATEHRAC